MSTTIFAGVPLVVSVNVDIETLDSERAGEAGLYGRYSYGRYGAREGFWRLSEVLKASAVKATFFLDPADARRNPEIVEAISADGHEIGLYGRAMNKFGGYNLAGLSAVSEGRDALAKLTGTAPVGWRSINGLVSREVLLDLARAGFTYDSSALDDDWPYLMAEGDLQLVELPVADYLKDATFYSGHHTHERVRKAWNEELDAIIADDGYIHLVLHTRGDHGSGRADRARIVAEFIERALRLPGVIPMRCDQVADVCRAKAEAETFLAEIGKPQAAPQALATLPI